jgi:hypothetical protein
MSYCALTIAWYLNQDLDATACQSIRFDPHPMMEFALASTKDTASDSRFPLRMLLRFYGLRYSKHGRFIEVLAHDLHSDR